MVDGQNLANIDNSQSFSSASSKKSNRVWQHVALFMITLILMLPIYVSNAQAASLSITSNSGEEQIQSFLNAQGDTWTVEVELGNLETDQTINPEQVILDIAGNEIPFQSCSGDAIATSCEFQSALTDGITEGNYPFSVRLFDLITDPNDETIFELGAELASDTDAIAADGSSPSISFTRLEQVDNHIELNFEVTDNPSGICVGLETVEIIDAESGTVLDTINLPSSETPDCSFVYSIDTQTGGKLQSTLTGEGRRFLKIKATDRLGHTKTSAAKSVETDFVAPTIVSGSLDIKDFGDYVGPFKQQSDVSVQVTECENLEEVVATSSNIEFLSQKASCESLDSAQCLWECTWRNLDVTPTGNSISATVTAKDEFANVKQSTVSKSFESDNTAPQLVYFGTEFTYDGISHAAAGEPIVIYAYIAETGAGVSTDTVKANLGGLSSAAPQTPNYCEVDLSGTADYVCSWEISSVQGTSGSSSSKEISLTTLNDNVGNQGIVEAVPVIVDAVAPQVKDIELFGVSAAGQKNFFQSNDDLVIKMTVQEGTGLLVYADVGSRSAGSTTQQNSVVLDALTKYQYGQTNEDGEYIASKWDGFAQFTESSCSRDSESGLWDCEFLIPSIKSGYDGSAPLEIIVFDTAGNEAQEWPESSDDVQNADGSQGRYDLEIFALDEETQPDFWEQSSANSGDDFVDLDIVELTYERVSFSAGLQSTVNARLALAELDECTSEVSNAPAIYRSLLLGGQTIEPVSNPSFEILLEFEPFDSETLIETDELLITDEFEKETIEYQCNLRVYSVLDDVALVHAEDQLITLPVDFRFSEQGALDENVNALISDHVNRAGFKILNAMDKVARILQYIELLFTALQVINTVINIFNFLSATTPKPADTAVCYGGTAIQAGTKNIFTKLLGVVSVFYCNPTPNYNTWMGSYQAAVLEYYKFIKGEWILGYAAAGITGNDPSATNAATQNLAGTWVGDQFNVKGAGPAYNDQLAAQGLLSANLNTQSLYDNIWVSALGLCPAGVVYNLQKLRQVHCAKLACLYNEVPAGLATVEHCNERFEYGVCKYVRGELLSLIPGVSILEGIGSIINKVVTDPVGVAFGLITVACFPACNYSGKVKSACEYVNMLVDVAQTVNSVAGAIKSVPSIQFDQCKDIDIKAFQQAAKGESQSSVTTSDVDVNAEGQITSQEVQTAAAES